MLARSNHAMDARTRARAHAHAQTRSHACTHTPVRPFGNILVMALYSYGPSATFQSWPYSVTVLRQHFSHGPIQLWPFGNILVTALYIYGPSATF